jgi:hypothetical protein
MHAHIILSKRPSLISLNIGSVLIFSAMKIKEFNG